MANQSAGQSASRKQLIIIGALFVVLLGIVYFMFLRGGGEDASTVTAPPPAAPVIAPDPGEDDEPVVPGKKDKGPVETSNVLAGKDPFEAVLDLTPDAGGGAAATETTTPTDGGTTTPTDDGTTTTPPDDGTTTPPPVVTPPPDDDGDDDEPKTGYIVRLLTVYKDDGVEKAIVEVTNRQTEKRTTYKNLVEGERFAVRFKLTSLEKNCASFLYGDELFGLCEGQRIIRK